LDGNNLADSNRTTLSRGHEINKFNRKEGTKSRKVTKEEGWGYDLGGGIRIPREKRVMIIEDGGYFGCTGFYTKKGGYERIQQKRSDDGRIEEQ